MKGRCCVSKRILILMVVFMWCLSPAGATEPESVTARVESVQLAAIASSPALQARLHQAAFNGAEARSEAAAINPYVEWQSQGLGSDRTLNAQDSLRVGTPFNFFGQMGPARDLARTTEEGLEVIQRSAVRSTAVEATRRWLDLAAAMERIKVLENKLKEIKK